MCKWIANYEKCQMNDKKKKFNCNVTIALDDLQKNQNLTISEFITNIDCQPPIMFKYILYNWNIRNQVQNWIVWKIIEIPIVNIDSIYL